MSDKQEQHLKLVRSEAAKSIGSALADLYRTLKVISFYPKEHPLLTEALLRAHQILQGALQGGPLSLIVSRGGFSLSTGASIDGNPMSQALAKELFFRRASQLTILPDLTPDDLKNFLSLLLMEPRRIAEAGGLERLMATRKIKTIWVNELDLSAIFAKQQAMEVEQEVAASDEEIEAALAASQEVQPQPPQEKEEEDIRELIQLMNEEFDDNRYIQLAELLVSKAEQLKGQGMHQALLHPVFSLFAHLLDKRRSNAQREHAAFTLQQITNGMADTLAEQVENKDFPRKDELFHVLKHLGAQTVPRLIERLGVADNLYARKSLASALVQIGEPSIPFLAAMLQDSRWYVIRNMVAILGEIGIPSSVRLLKGPAYHEDARVRKETIRSLSKIGGTEAEAILIGLLTTKDRDVKQQAVLSLGIMRSQTAVQPLLDIVWHRDFFGDLESLKREALLAIGRIGDRRAVPYLVKFLNKKPLFTVKSLEGLKIAAASALGNIGDESALEPLHSLSKRGGRLSAACNEAIDAIERLPG
ncbi:MAG: HEAT repeat domain-containing protein [Geobacter sp.]|nr:HEAT repeat domain-containing protein [Geobacter sp.]